MVVDLANETAMVFVDSDKEVVGKLFINGEGELSFKGKATATAEIFMDALIAEFNNLEFYNPDEEDQE